MVKNIVIFPQKKMVINPLIVKKGYIYMYIILCILYIYTHTRIIRIPNMGQMTIGHKENVLTMAQVEVPRNLKDLGSLKSEDHMFAGHCLKGHC